MNVAQGTGGHVRINCQGLGTGEGQKVPKPIEGLESPQSVETAASVYGLVFAISGTASPTLFGCSGPRWYLVSPSRRYSKPSSGESTILNNSMSCGEIVPESAKAWKLITRFQYSLP